MLDTKKGYIKLGDKTYTLAAKGVKQAAQVGALSAWLSTFGSDIFSKLTDEDGNIPELSTYMLIIEILKNVSTEAIIELYMVFVGCPKKVAEEYFDIGDLVEVIEYVWNNQHGIRRLANRFFSTNQPQENSEEPTT